MIYDCFIFFNELDLLEIRLNELNESVDKFVLVESTKTFTGKDKELYFEKNKHLFEKYLDKIIHIVVDDFEEGMSAWDREIHQRNSIKRGLSDCKPSDVIIISDVDEIINPQTLDRVKNKPGIKVLEQKLYYYYLNCINANEPYWLRGPRVLFFEDYTKTADEIRNTDGELIKNGGWHFTYLGGTEAIIRKIQSFSHQEYNNDYYTNPEKIESDILSGKDIFERGYDYKIVNVDKSFPSYLLKNKDKYDNLILKKLAGYKKTGFKRKNRFIEDYSSSNKFPILDFINRNNKNILVVSENQEFVNLLNEKNQTECKVLNYQDNLINEINKFEDKTIDCAIFENTFGKVAYIEEVLNLLRQKMAKNGYVVANVQNFRHFNSLNTLLNKKRSPLATPQALYTKKDLDNLFNRSKYHFVTFKGLKPIKSFKYGLFDLLSFYNLYDAKHEEFLLVAKH